MVWVGSFTSLQSALRKPRPGAPLEVHTWLRSEIALISPFTDWLMSLIAGSRSVRGKEDFVELALREAMNNAILHGNRMHARRLVHVRCCCENIEGVLIVVRASLTAVLRTSAVSMPTIPLVRTRTSFTSNEVNLIE